MPLGSVLEAPGFWVFVAVIVLILIAVFFRPPPTKQCPECAERVKDAARTCKHCGHRFADASP
jgi:tRNA(Ile2) C34 agmatinyltransferase TiaS